jgi:hypothetical protein
MVTLTGQSHFMPFTIRYMSGNQPSLQFTSTDRMSLLPPHPLPKWSVNTLNYTYTGCCMRIKSVLPIIKKYYGQAFHKITLQCRYELH